MADVLEEYVTQVIDKKMQNSDYLIAIPSKVTQVLSNGMYVVQLISNGSEYCVPNWSGADLEVGDNVHLYYKGKILSDRTAYIGAAFHQNNHLEFIVGNSQTGRIIPDAAPATFATINFTATIKTNIFVCFNANLITNSMGSNTVTVYLDNVPHTYQHDLNLSRGWKYTQNFTLPFEADAGEHTVLVKINGSGDVTYAAVYAYVFGQGIKEVENG